ncbi:MAG: hypothetical protein R3F65_32210 [bacterium]
MVGSNTRRLAQIGLGGVLLAESMAAWSRWEQRRRLFAAAMERARATRRRLVVALPEREGATTRAMRLYEMGGHFAEVLHSGRVPIVRPGELERGPVARVASDSAVVYAACVLEYVGDLPAAMSEILRMAGAVDNVFVVTVQPWTLTAALHPRARWAGIAEAHTVSMGPITALHRGFAAGVVLGLAAVSASGRPREAEERAEPAPGSTIEVAAEVMPARGGEARGGTG